MGGSFTDIAVNLAIISVIYIGYLSCATVHKASIGSHMYISKSTFKYMNKVKNRTIYSNIALDKFDPVHNIAIEYTCWKHAKTFIYAYVNEICHMCGCMISDRYSTMNTNTNSNTGTGIESDSLLSGNSTNSNNNTKGKDMNVEMKTNVVQSPMTIPDPDPEKGETRAHTNSSISNSTGFEHKSNSNSNNILQNSLNILTIEGGSTPCECGYMLLLNMGSQFLCKHSLREIPLDTTGLICVISVVGILTIFQILFLVFMHIKI